MEFPENIVLIAGITLLFVSYVVVLGVHPHWLSCRSYQKDIGS